MDRRTCRAERLRPLAARAAARGRRPGLLRRARPGCCGASPPCSPTTPTSVNERLAHDDVRGRRHRAHRRDHRRGRAADLPGPGRRRRRRAPSCSTTPATTRRRAGGSTSRTRPTATSTCKVTQVQRHPRLHRLRRPRRSTSRSSRRRRWVCADRRRDGRHRPPRSDAGTEPPTSDVIEDMDRRHFLALLSHARARRPARGVRRDGLHVHAGGRSGVDRLVATTTDGRPTRRAAPPIGTRSVPRGSDATVEPTRARRQRLRHPICTGSWPPADPTGNLVISPASIAIALTMTSAGARGETLDEMLATLHVAGRRATIHRSMNALTAQLRVAAADGRASSCRSRTRCGARATLGVRAGVPRPARHRVRRRDEPRRLPRRPRGRTGGDQRSGSTSETRSSASRELLARGRRSRRDPARRSSTRST